MNAADHNQEVHEPVVQGPGKQLREIRLARNLDINQVAGLLHLNVSLLEALEADDFSKLPSPVFVQGYLRNYARLLDVPVTPILDAFQHYRPVADETMHLKASQIRHEVRSSHTVVRVITWLIVIGIIALVVTWWRGYLQWPISLGLEGDNPPVAQQAGDPPPVTESQPVAPDGTVTLPPLAERPEILDAPVSDSAAPLGSTPSRRPDDQTTRERSDAPPATLEEMPQPAVSDSAAPSDDVAQGRAADVTVAGEVVTPGADQPPATAQVQVSFSEACWTEIRDATGGYRVIGNKTAGERLMLAGEAPYQMVFGNASAVSILVNGSAYDLAPHTRSNVARFTLDIE
ncbi:RodZ domain-containing protein [Sedimenticola hydrogenitrophicus]|uniref:RodZ domain-containing protein n=1 Tax=Sedimenticola hydrogenitrophicus TaxID=2967975 RepID=UPI0021A78D23|nr:RodZ family helix-turn-helix domain-containing protein [Sedimenticola hydrogenitrophicus]